MSFEQDVIQAAQASIIKLISSGDWLKMDYGSKIELPRDMMRSVYSGLDMDLIRQRVKEACEQRVADAVIHAMATEIATDAKKILSNAEIREDVRAFLRAKMREAVTAIAKTGDA